MRSDVALLESLGVAVDMMEGQVDTIQDTLQGLQTDAESHRTAISTIRGDFREFKVAHAGLSKEDITVQVTDSMLMIKGDYYCCERSFGSFSRSIDLPSDVKADHVRASLKDGVLEIRLPKTEEAKKRAATVRID